MGRDNKNARSRPHGRRIHVNKYINRIGRTKESSTSHGSANSTEQARRSNAVRSAGVYPGNATLAPRPTAPAHKAYGPAPRRYEVWFADLGDHHGTSVQSGNRPVLIISNDVGNLFSNTVTVIPLTTKFKKLEMPTHVVLCQEDCCMLRPEAMQDSLLLAEQITTIDKSALSNTMCRILSQEKQNEIERAVAAQLGLSGEQELENREGAAREAGVIQGIDTAQGGNASQHDDAPMRTDTPQHDDASQRTDASQNPSTTDTKEVTAW